MFRSMSCCAADNFFSIFVVNVQVSASYVIAGALGYADDITRLAPTLTGLKYTVPTRIMAPATIYFKRHFSYSSMR